jgi:lipoprotein-releasing system ATP-binding protein
MNETLRLNNISRTYKKGQPGEVAVLQNVDFTLNAGEVVGLVAPSGAGKSTLLHIAGLLDTPDSGTIHICGQDMSGKPDRQRTRVRRQDIGFIYQFHHLLAEFTALENITLPQFANGIPASEAEAHARELLASVGLTERANHRPAEMSGGEQQRVAFCRALANRPRILLADEPTGNLDPATSDTVFSGLMELVRATGLSALIATHNMALADRMDRKVRLENGALVDI